jgi:amino acid transporter
VFYSAVIGWVLLLALTFAVQKSNLSAISAGTPFGFPALTILTTALSSAAAKAVILISTIGQLFCGMACVTSGSRMTFAFSRDGAIPGHHLWRRLGANKTPSYAVLFVCVMALVITIPAFFPNSAGYPVAFFAVTSIAVIGLYIAYTIPVYLRWRMGDAFQTGPWTLGRKYKWINPIAIVWVGLCVIIFCLPVSPAGVYFSSAFDWSAVTYAPLVTLGVMVMVTVWYLVSARRTFTGPVRTIQFAEDGVTVVDPDAQPV